MNARAFRLLLAAVGLSLAVAGGYLMTVIEDVFGDEYRRYGSLGLALLALGLVVAIPSAVAVGWPNLSAAVGDTVRRRLDTPGRLLLIAVGLGAVAAMLLGITAQAGGFVLYHPYDFPAIGLGLLAVVLVVRSVMGYLSLRIVRGHR